MYDAGSDRPNASFLPGTYWPGGGALQETDYADWLLTTEIARDGGDVRAAAANALRWLKLWRSPAEVRLLTALDALGEHRYGQRVLGDVAGLGWNLVVTTLQRLDREGLIEKKRGLIRLSPEQKGRYW